MAVAASASSPNSPGRSSGIGIGSGTARSWGCGGRGPPLTGGDAGPLSGLVGVGGGGRVGVRDVGVVVVVPAATPPADRAPRTGVPLVGVQLATEHEEPQGESDCRD